MQPSRGRDAVAGRYRRSARAAAAGNSSAAGSRWCPTARAAGCTSNAKQATGPARSRSTRSSSAALFAIVFVDRDRRSPCPTSRSRCCSRSSCRSWARPDRLVPVLEDDLGRGRPRVPPALDRTERPDEQVGHSSGSTRLTRATLRAAGRSRAAVRTPSTNVQVASPTIAKSWKSSCACSMNRCAPARRPAAAAGAPPRPRARGSARASRRHRADRRRPSRANATQHARTSTRGPARRGRRARTTSAKPSAHARARPSRRPGAARSRTRARRRARASRGACASRSSIASGPVGPDDQRAARLVARDLVGQRRRLRARRRTAGSTRSSRARRAASSGSASNHEPVGERARAWPRSRRCSRARRRARRRSRRSPTPRRRAARPRARARSRPNRCRGRRRPRSARRRRAQSRRRTRRSPRRCRLLERDLHDLLGLGPRDQHPPVDEQVEPAERPRAEHVLQRLARDRGARPSRRSRARAARRRRRVGDRRPLGRRVARHLLDDEPRLGLGR